MKSKFVSAISIFLLIAVPVLGQKKPPAYTAFFERADSLPIVFNLDIEKMGGREQWIIRNAEERIRVTDIRTAGDSSWISMPFFESDFKLKKTVDGGYEGIWIKGTTGKPLEMPVKIRPGSTRFASKYGQARSNVSGRWAVTFIRPNGTSRPSIAEFRQDGDKLTGTFLTPSGDYRYLEGIMSGDSLQLSCFDGSHAYFFGARLDKNGQLVNGVFASSATWLEPWYATRDKNAKIDETLAAMQLRPGEERIGFRFPGIDSQMVSLNDQRFRNKVVVIQIMGSWCPNCMDETAFLTEYYRKNRSRGVEMIGLAYEYSTDFARASKSLAKFRDRFDVQYPLLITGVTSTDSLKTEKTLPQLTPIKAFPSTIFIGKDGKVKTMHAGFYGPGTGIHHEEYKQKFYATIEELLKQYP